MKRINWILLIAFSIFSSCMNENQKVAKSNDLSEINHENELTKEDSLEISINKIFDDLLNNRWAIYNPDTISVTHFRRTDLMQKEFLKFKYLAFRGRIRDCFILNPDKASILASKGSLLFQINLSRDEFDRIFLQNQVSYVYFLVNNFKFNYDILNQDGTESYDRLINCELVDFAIR